MIADPRTELEMLDTMDRMLAHGLLRADQTERLLLLAAEYTFPVVEREPPVPATRRTNARELVIETGIDRVRVAFAGEQASFVVEAGEPLGSTYDAGSAVRTGTLERGLRIEDDAWTEAHVDQMRPVLLEWVRYRVPFDYLWFPGTGLEPDPPIVAGTPIRTVRLPTDFLEEHGIPETRYALAARDHARWHQTYRRLRELR